MALRTAVAYWKSMAGLPGSSKFTTLGAPKMSAYAPTADHSLASAEGFKTKSKMRGEFMAVYVLLGFIALQMGFGVFTVFHQMARAPNVALKKSRRETIPEVVEPERVAEDGEKFIKQSFFRKIAHIQDFDRQEIMDDPIRGDVFARPVRVESLKDVGVEVKPH
ncbi:Unknown protein [Striga hermonthica]|uniref:Uncharacterized protein n=1 Tax=Striga hermonthica TaxID=68872 RepID=A0A9N7N5W8_STRHE|nr:Unknown protein [Striga hermonthica]